MDPAEYLAEDFDISKLTVPKIRSILVEHEVHFPSNANKSELINLFNSQVKPYSSTILAKYTIEPTSDGILKEHNSDSENLIEPIKISDKDKTIPSKRHSNEQSERTTKKKIRKHQNENFSDSTSNADSFFETSYNENVNILNVSDTKFKKKPLNAEQLLAKIDQSTPGSSSLKRTSNLSTPIKRTSPSIDTESQIPKGERLNLDKFMNSSDDITPLSPPAPVSDSHDIFFNNQRDEVILVDDDENIDEDMKSENHLLISQSPELSSTQVKSTVILEGPTANLKESIIISSTDDEMELEPLSEHKKLSSKEESVVPQQSSISTVEVNFTEKSVDNENEVHLLKSTETSINNHKEEDVVYTEVESKVSTSKKAICAEEPKETEQVPNTTHELPVKHNHLKKMLKLFIITFAMVGIFLMIIIASCLREIKMNTGYCGVEGPERKIDILQTVPSFLQEQLSPYASKIDFLESTLLKAGNFDCKECPEHANCKLNEIECEYGYRKAKTYKSLFGLVPLEEYCEYDYFKEEQNHYLINYTLKLLHKNNGKLSLEELHEYLKDTKPSSMQLTEFEEYWKEFVEKDFKDMDIDVNLTTKEIKLIHKTPTQFYTRNYGTESRSKKLFDGSYGLPTAKQSNNDTIP